MRRLEWGGTVVGDRPLVGYYWYVTGWDISIVVE
jgi:hypothetical protein